MLPEITYWARAKGAGYYTYLLAGGQPLDVARQALSAALRATNPGPWLDGEQGVAAVVSDDRLDAVLVMGVEHDSHAQDRFGPFMAMDRLSESARDMLLKGGSATDRGGEICACFGVSTAAVREAIGKGATSLAELGAATQAGTNCGSCRPELRALLRAHRLREAA